MTQVLVVDDEDVLARSICSYLNKKGFTAEHRRTGAEAVEAFRKDQPSLTLLDYRLGTEDGLETLHELRSIDPDARIVMMTGHGDIGVAVDAMKAGANDFLTKPVKLSSIAGLAAECVPDAAGAPSCRAYPMIMGRSAAMDAMCKAIDGILHAVSSARVSPPSVLISGETGTGKELVARTLHMESPRAAKPFISINCAALPDHLIEAELFGYQRGAFTDARDEKPGLFEAADGGVLFLDEIGELSPQVQAKLLRALEERRIRRIGALEDREVDVWVLSASNRSLADMVSAGAFRADLMFRLEVLTVESPPLRERDGDVLLLATHFLGEIARRYDRPVPVLSDTARAQLVAHRWPGNVRELRNAIERALIANPGKTIEGINLQTGRASSVPEAHDRPAGLKDLEIAAIRDALDQTAGNVTRAAGLLEVSRDTLRYRIVKYGIRL